MITFITVYWMFFKDSDWLELEQNHKYELVKTMMVAKAVIFHRKRLLSQSWFDK